MTPEQKPENTTPIESTVADKIVDTSLKAIITDSNGEICIKRAISGIFLVIGMTLGLIIFWKGLSNPEADYVGSCEIFQFFVVSGLAGLGLSTVEGLFKKK